MQNMIILHGAYTLSNYLISEKIFSFSQPVCFSSLWVTAFNRPFFHYQEPP